MSVCVFIDTTLQGASIALVSGSQSFKEIYSHRGDSDSAICRILETGLKSLSKSLDDIDTIVVSHGPGSFTGIKVGLAWAYGFQAARSETLLFGMSSLAEGCQELQRRDHGKRTIVMLPISRREAFLCWYDKSGSACFTSLVLNSDSAESELKKLEHENDKIVMISAETKVQEWVKTLFGTKAETLSMQDFMDCALEAMMTKAKTLDFSKLKSRHIVPQYLKKTSVEEKFETGKTHV